MGFILPPFVKDPEVETPRNVKKVSLTLPDLEAVSVS